MLFKNFILQVIAGILGLWIASEFVSGVEVINPWQTLICAGLVLGLITYLIKPILNLITWPIRVLTLGLFSLVINMGIIWLIDVLFSDFFIKGIAALFWTTFIVWIFNIIALKIISENKSKLHE